MHEIKIYGYISNIAEKSDKEVSLLDVQEQLKLANGQAVKVRINSHGGDADEGFAIYNELRRYAKDNDVQVHTFAESRLGSIATVIFLAGDKRELSADLQPFVHKAYFEGADELTEPQQNQLNTINARLANHYANHTDLSYDEALELMNAETFINTEEAKAMRFATDIEQVLRPVALKRFINVNNNEMNKNTKSASILAKAMEFLKSVGGSPVNKLVSTADEMELDFYELAQDDMVEVGAKARIDGADAEGSYVMKEGETFVFVAGELTEIVAKAEEVISEDVVAMQATINDLTAKLEAVTAHAMKQDTILANYKNIVSASNKDEGKGKPAKVDAPVASNISEKIQNLKTIKLK